MELLETSEVMRTPGRGAPAEPPMPAPGEGPRVPAVEMAAAASGAWPGGALAGGVSGLEPPVRRPIVLRVEVPELGAIWLAADSRPAPPPVNMLVSRAAI